MVGASARTCKSQYNVQLQASTCLQSIVSSRGEGTDLEFGKRCPHFISPSYGRAVADSQNFWRLEMRTLFCRSNRPSSGPCVAVFICLVCYFEAVGADGFFNFWLRLTMGRNKMVLAGHPRPCETRLWPGGGGGG